MATQLEPGAQLGPYRIEGPLGAGGMGQVYKARDTRLGRDVAIKICAEKFSDRFEHEARTVAGLNHPNICTLYDVGSDFIAMELVEGQTLAARIRRGPIPLAEVLSNARQIAAALEAAHEKGIVHRDLKPGNVMVKTDGSVKVLDFGLAKKIPSQPDAGESTFTLAQTQAGAVVGTAAYMAPEQARGHEIDKRADIWAFGVVLYEMLTGNQPFKGATSTDTLAAVLTREPDWVNVPLPVQRLLRRCLEKDPRRRLRDIGDAAIELDELILLGTQSTSRETKWATSVRWMWLLTTVAALVLAAATLLLTRRGAEQPAASLTRTTISLPPRASMGEGDVGLGGGPARQRLALSPDGRSLVYAASEGGRSQLYLRRLSDFDAKPLAGTQGGNFPTFSPDGRWVAFFADYKLQKVPIAGGRTDHHLSSPNHPSRRQLGTRRYDHILRWSACRSVACFRRRGHA
jgi:tRNA A-37 threonylcarbamoyl transferase component Bud32